MIAQTQYGLISSLSVAVINAKAVLEEESIMSGEVWQQVAVAG